MDEENEIEIIELDSDEPERTVLEKVETTGCIDLVQDENIGSTTDEVTFQTTLQEPVHGKKVNKTLALIPVDYLKYCDVRDGKFTVKLNTFNKLTNNSAMFLYQMPQDSHFGENRNNIKNKEKILVLPKNAPSESKIQISTDPHVIKLLKGNDRKFEQETLITQNIPVSQKSSVASESSLQINTMTMKPLSKSVAPETLPVSNKPLSTSLLKYSVKKVMINPHIQSSSIKKVVKKPKSIQQNMYLNVQNSSLPSHNPGDILLNDSRNVVPVAIPTVQQSRKPMKKLKQDSIDLSEERDPLDISTFINNPSSNDFLDSSSPPPLVPIEKKGEMNKNTSCNTGFGRSTSPINSDTESAEELLYSRGSSDDNLFESRDPLGDLPNIFEPIITLNELKDEHNSIENTLTEGLRGRGIPDGQMQELENMVRNNTITSPVKVMIPSKFLKYCKKKNGKYSIDINSLKKINEEKQRSAQSMSRALDDRENVVQDSGHSNKSKTKICTRKRNQNKSYRYLHLTPIMPSVMPISNYYSFPDEPIFSDRCRFLYMKRSGWYNLDPESRTCKGFNEREEEISNVCFKNFSKYFDCVLKDCRKLGIRKRNDNKVLTAPAFRRYIEVPRNEDLYFTKKIEILDTKGRKVRTEHLIQKNRPNIKNEVKNKKQKLINNIEYMLTRVKPCKVVIERLNLKYYEIRKKLHSKFVRNFEALNQNTAKPIIILNKHNLHYIKLNESFCKNNYVLFVKQIQDDFPEQIYKNEFFNNMVEKNFITITSPFVLQHYFSQEKIIKKF